MEWAAYVYTRARSVYCLPYYFLGRRSVESWSGPRNKASRICAHAKCLCPGDYYRESSLLDRTFTYIIMV